MSSNSQAMIHYEKGKLNYQGKKFQEAIDEFTEAIRLKPDSPNTLSRFHNARGVVYFYLGEFKKVIKDCGKALELDPKNANYHNCRGNAYFSLGKFGKAAEDFTQAISLSPEASHGRYYNNRGSAFRRLKQFKEAVDDYTKAIGLDPKNGNYYNNRGNTYFDMGEFQLAIDDFTKALGLEPYSPKTKLTLAQAHEALAQEQRMKHVSRFKGVWSHQKLKGTQAVRKSRDVEIWVSPKGVECTYTRGWRKKPDSVAFDLSEDMKIVLRNDKHVRLYVDQSLKTWVDFLECDATAVEEELIGRITTKFASYSTACLVNQHEGVVMEYTTLVKQLVALKAWMKEHNEVMKMNNDEKQRYIDEDNLVGANELKAQMVSLQRQMDAKEKEYAEKYSDAEHYRQKANSEAGPVLDMVLIMQKRVDELYETKVKTTDKYREEDLKLEEQKQKMEGLVTSAGSLMSLVSQPLDELIKKYAKMDKRLADAFADEEEEDFPEEEEEEEEEEEPEPEPVAAAPVKAAEPEPEPEPEPVPEPEPEPEPVKEEPVKAAAPEPEPEPEPQRSLEDLKDESSDESDWDDFDVELPESFKPSGNEVFMTIETGNMVTITPSRNTEDVAVMKKEELAAMTEEQKALADKLRRLEEEKAAAEEKLVKKLMAKDEELQVRDQAMKEWEAKLSEQDRALQSLAETKQSMVQIRSESDNLKEQLAQKMSEMEQNTTHLSSKLEMTAAEKSELQRKVAAQQAEAERLKTDLERVNSALSTKVQEAEEKAAKFESMANKGAELELMLEQVQKETANDKQKMADMQKDYDDRMNRMKEESNALRDALEATEQEKVRLAKAVEEQTMTLSQMRKHLATVQKQLQTANEEKTKLVETTQALKGQTDQLLEQQRKDELKRRELHNLLQEYKGNIRVYIRIRPELQGKNKHELFQEVPGSDGQELQVFGEESASTTGGKRGAKSWNFKFDRIFWPKDAQGTVFEEINQLVQSALDGFRVSIFAYGQTGSGKTYTMQGPDNPTPEQLGMIPRSIKSIFDYRETMREKGWEYECEVCFVENYLDGIRDLLSGEPLATNNHKLIMVKEGKETKTVVDGVTWVGVNSADDLTPILARADSARTSAETKSNERSSRSHAVFTMRIRGTHEKSGTTSLGVLNLIDLAGSERIEKSGVTGQRLKETQAINSSLTCLGDVIAALASGSKHVPFRNAKLTHMLQDSFGKGAKTLMFINLAGEATHLSETVCSLRFGAKVHDCHIGKATKSLKAGGKRSKKKK